MSKRYLVALALLAALPACTDTDQRCDVSSTLSADAPAGAIDCGTSHNDTERAQVASCVADAGRKYAPLIVRDEQPVDPRYQWNAHAWVGTRMKVGFEYYWDTRDPSGTLTRRECDIIGIDIDDTGHGTVSCVSTLDPTFHKVCR
jgi:hypothetical protein